MNAPRCPIHVGAEMVLREEPIPAFVWLSEEQQATRKKTRKIWKCPILGCPRVALCEEAPEAEHLCPNCKRPTDSKRLNNDHRCHSCKREYDQSRRARIAHVAARARWAAVAAARGGA